MAQLIAYLYFYPLQTLSQFNTESWDVSPMHKFSIIGIFVIIAIFVFLNVSKTVKNSKVFQSGSVDIKTSEDNEFHSYAQSKYKLNRREINYLFAMLKGERAEPIECLKNPKLLDNAFKANYQNLIKDLDYSPNVAKELRTLFAIKKVISYFDRVHAAGNSQFRTELRQSLRKNLYAACTYTIVEEVTEKKNGQKITKLVLTDKIFTGIFVDISAVGCAFKSDKQCRTATKIKIEWTLDNIKMAALGVVVRVNKDKSGIVMHVKFLKVPDKAFFHISAFVYDWSTPAPTRRRRVR